MVNPGPTTFLQAEATNLLGLSTVGVGNEPGPVQMAPLRGPGVTKGLRPRFQPSSWGSR